MDEMKRWLAMQDRRPFMISGARQTGKTWLCRQLVEINFERNPELGQLFQTNDPRSVITNLSVTLNIDIDPEKSLLFLDEVQACAFILGKLRWFCQQPMSEDTNVRRILS